MCNNNYSFCSIGAVHKVLGNALFVSDNNNLSKALALSIDGTYSRHVSWYNDTHTHAEVMQMWDKAIWLAEFHEQSVCDNSTHEQGEYE